MLNPFAHLTDKRYGKCSSALSQLMDLLQCTSRIYSVPAVRNTTLETQRLNMSCQCRAQIMASLFFVIAGHCGIICPSVWEDQTS